MKRRNPLFCVFSIIVSLFFLTFSLQATFPREEEKLSLIIVISRPNIPLMTGVEYRIFNHHYREWLFLSDDRTGNPPDRIVEARNDPDNRGRTIFDIQRVR